jgi:hypothetical protein
MAAQVVLGGEKPVGLSDPGKFKFVREVKLVFVAFEDSEGNEHQQVGILFKNNIDLISNNDLPIGLAKGGLRRGRAPDWIRDAAFAQLGLVVETPEEEKKSDPSGPRARAPQEKMKGKPTTDAELVAARGASL